LQELDDSDFPDNDRFNEILNTFDIMHQQIIDVVYKPDQPNDVIVSNINGSLVKWNDGIKMIESTKDLNISKTSHDKAQRILVYMGQRSEEFGLMKRIVETNDASLMPQLDSTRVKVDRSMKAIIPE
jgi:hypothetical protein